jgi:hypothetical protein
MDLALAIDLLSLRPAEIDAARASCTGAWLPVVVPVGWLDAATRGDWMLAEQRLPSHLRVQAALEAGNEAAAWRIVSDLRGAPLAEPRMSAVLRNWAARQQAGLALPATGDPVLVTTSSGRNPKHEHLAAAALRDAQGLFPSLLWPRWAGPAVVVIGEGALGCLAADQRRIARHALPLLRIDAGLDDAQRRQALSRAFTELVLDLERGEQSWPAWFQDGMAAMAEARARGEGPSPRAMQEIRSRAGSDAIRRSLLASEPDPELAFALCAYACHTRRAAQLPALMDLLRNGVDGITAFEIAYGANLDTLATQR